MRRQLWWGLAALVLLVFLYRVRSVLTPFLFAVVIAYILYPLVVLFETKGFSRVGAILIIYTALAIVAGVVLWTVAPRLVSEIDTVMEELPRQIKHWEALVGRILGVFRRLKLPGSAQDALNLVMERLEILVEGLLGKLTELVMGAFANLISLVIAPVLAFYFLRDHQSMRARSLQYVPAQYRGDIQYLMSEINYVLNGFFRGQLLVSLFVGAFIYLGLLLLGIPNSLFIGVIVGIFDIIPYFGPILGFVPAAAFALVQSPLTVLWVLVLFIGANQIENSLISPKIIGDRVGLHPLVVIFVLLVGGYELGIVGMLIAVPVAATLRVLLDYFLLPRTNSSK